MSDVSDTIEEAHADAKLARCEVIVGDDTTLLLDLDGDWDHTELYERILHRIHVLYTVTYIEEWTSRSGQNIHRLIKLLVPVDKTTRIALQACLGSDPMREFIGIRRIFLGLRDEPNLLFRPIGAEVRRSTPFPELDFGDETPL